MSTKSMIHTLFSKMLALGGLYFLAACQFPSMGPAVPINIYAGPTRSLNEVAKITFYQFKPDPSGEIGPIWHSGIKAIDNISIANFNVAYVLPGRHKFTMWCSSKIPGVKVNEQQVIEMDVSAGKKYYPWAGISSTIAKHYSGKIASGYCTPFLSTENPISVR
jgi:hypothetical protein